MMTPEFGCKHHALRSHCHHDNHNWSLQPINIDKVEFSKQKQLLLSQTPVCFLISVFSASKSSFYFLKPQFAFSFWCFPQAKAAFTFSNPSLLSHLSSSRNLL
jgi:hypothetical protein